MISVAKPQLIGKSLVGMTPVIFAFLSMLVAYSTSAQEAASTTLDMSNGVFEARALIRSSERIEYRNQLVAPIKSVDFSAGETFRKGDPLVIFDCASYEAEAKAAKASAKAAAIDHATKQRLLRYQAIGKSEVSLAAAQSSEAQAQVEVHEVRNQACRFEAPFDGRVVDVNAKPHEFPPANEPLIVIIDDSKLEMELVVPSNWLRWIRPGEKFGIVVDETGEAGTGIVERIAAEVDPVSQTVKLIAVFEERPPFVLAGMSGSVRFETPSN